MIGLADIDNARRQIAGKVYLSPCIQSEALTKLTGSDCWLKLESLQLTGSFKERGACNRLTTMTPDETARGVICASAGNHAQGVALHAARLGIDATIVMPEAAALNKVENTRRFAGDSGLQRIVLHGANFDEAFEEATRMGVAEGRTFVHPFDDDRIIAGQGTIGLELLDQCPALQAVLVAVGGGGLIGGIALAIKELRPDIKIYGVETSTLPSMKEAVRRGSPVTVPAARTIAEGIAIRRASDRTLALVNRYVDDIVLVDEEEIASAILTLLEREKTVAEGAGAAPLAALMHGRLPQVKGQRVVLVVGGGNIDVNVISRIIERGLAKSGRIMRLAVRIPDVAGALAQLAVTVASTRANIIEIRHERMFADAGLSEAVVELLLEMRGRQHGEDLLTALGLAGYVAHLA